MKILENEEQKQRGIVFAKENEERKQIEEMFKMRTQKLLLLEKMHLEEEKDLNFFIQFLFKLKNFLIKPQLDSSKEEIGFLNINNVKKVKEIALTHASEKEKKNFRKWIEVELSEEAELRRRRIF